jgi:hypothetical protein
MAKNSALILAAALVLGGVYLILSSPTMGLEAAGRWLQGIGGGTDTAKFMAMVDAYIEAYRLLGVVLVASGMYGVFRSLRSAA